MKPRAREYRRLWNVEIKSSIDLGVSKEGIKIKLFCILVGIVLLMTVAAAANGTAIYSYNTSENVTLGNYSFAFNMSEPHKIVTFFNGENGRIYTFGNMIEIAIGSGVYGLSNKGGIAVPELLDSTSKKISGEGYEYMTINKIEGTAYGTVYRLEYGKVFDIDCTYDLTRSLKFFDEVQITRIKK